MSDENQNQNKTHWLYAIIGVLAVAVLIQSSLLIRSHYRSTSQKKSHPVFAQRMEPKEEEPAAMAPQSFPASPVAMTPQYRHSQRLPFRSLDDETWEDPFVLMAKMQSNINRLMNSALASGLPRGFAQGGAVGGLDFSPALDVQETEKTYVVRCDIPGLDKDKINVTVRNNLMTIQGVRETANETKDSKNGFYAQERSYGSFARSIPLPGPVEESAITADYKNGVLTVTLPKTAGGTNAKKVAIQ